MVTLEKTYEMAENPPQPMSWEEYEEKLTQEWQSLLDSDCSEKEIHAFLEKHPCLLPGAFTMNRTSGHYPYPDAVISLPPLSGVGKRVPDFMWLSTCSIEFEVVLIEIERPNKKTFTSKGNPTSDFTQAQTQLAEWKVWFGNPTNQQVFYDTFGIPLFLKSRKFRISPVLIYGRRHEFSSNPKLTRLRGELVRQDERLMSFDRLKPERKANYLYTVRFNKTGFQAVAYPPTYVLGPGLANNYSTVLGKEEAIDKCEWMSSERKEFIKNRFPYWQEWARRDKKGTIYTGDFE